MKLALLALSCQAVFFTLPGFVEYCFAIDGQKSRKISGAFVVSGEGDQHVLTRFFDSQRKPKFTSPKNSREGSFESLLEHDEYHELCFKALDADEKTISFEFSQDEDTSVIAEDQFGQINDEVSTTSGLLHSVYRNVHFYERREMVHRDLAEKTCDNILWSVLIKISVLCALSLAQVYVLRELFNNDKLRV